MTASVTAPILGIVCGMQSEADLLGRLTADKRVRVAVSGARPDLAKDGARWLVAEGCKRLLSFGVAGGLAPELTPGMLVIADRVVTEDGTSLPLNQIDPDLPATEQMPGTLLGADRMVFSADEKATLHNQTTAIAVDMETHRVARVAHEAGLPTHALRVIGDPVTQSLPPFLSDAISATGHPRIMPVLAGLLRTPHRLPDLLRLKANTDTGLKRLRALVEAGHLRNLLAG